MTGNMNYRLRQSKAETLRLEDWPFTREEALLTGKAYYIAPKPCRAGHMWLRRTDSRACVMCTELARGCNQARASAGRTVGNAISEHLRSVFETPGPKGGVQGLNSAQAPFDLLLEMAKAGEHPAALSWALENAPIIRFEVRPEGQFFELTAAGRALGRAFVASMLVGDAINAELLRAIK